MLQRAWNGDVRVDVRAVNTVITRLRRKLEPDAGVPRLILTVRGAGYKLTE